MLCCFVWQVIQCYHLESQLTWCFSLLVVTALQDTSILTASPLGSACAVFNWFTLSEPSVAGVEVWPDSVTCRCPIPDLGRAYEKVCANNQHL